MTTPADPLMDALDRLKYQAGVYLDLDDIQTLRTGVAELRASLDTLYGAKFSDRSYHALKSRAEAAEAALYKGGTMSYYTQGAFKRMDVEVEIIDLDTDDVFRYYRTNLANDGERRVFAEQMTNAYAGGQYTIVAPLQVIPR